jgi:methanogenic corrinoid protein MtbC1
LGEIPVVTAPSDRELTTMPEPAAVDELLARLDERVVAHDRPGLVAEALRAVDSGEIDVATLYHDVLVPLMKSVGERWQVGEMRIWEEHLASAAVRTVVEALYPRVQGLKAAAGGGARGVLLACPVGEEHDLGLRMLSDVFEVNGWDTYYLGPDTPTVQLADAARTLGVEAVVLASVTLFEQVQTRHILDDLERRLPGVRVVVACSGDVCRDTSIRENEVFVAQDFFGGPHPGPDAGPAKEGR